LSGSSITSPEYNFTIIGGEREATFKIREQFCCRAVECWYSVKLGWLVLSMGDEIDVVSVMRKGDFVVNRISGWDELEINKGAELHQPEALTAHIFLGIYNLFPIR
jgi:hypothetical protein